MTSLRILVGALGGGVVMHAATPAYAVTTTVSYKAAMSCPTRDSFVELVRRQGRGPAFELVAQGPSDVLVQIDKKGADYAGRLEVVRTNAILVRTMVAKSCQEVTSALAFVLGLALSERGSSEQRSGEAPGSQTGDGLDWPGLRAVPDPNDTAPWQMHVGGRGVLSNAAAPGWGWGWAGFLELRPPRRRRLTPTVRAGVVMIQPHADRISGFFVDTSWVAGRAEAAPIRLQLAPPLDLLTAVGLELGSLNAGIRAASERRVWFDMFVGLRAELRPTSWLSFELQAELTFPITRHNYPLDSEGIGYQVGFVAGMFAAGLTIRVL